MEPNTTNDYDSDSENIFHNEFSDLEDIEEPYIEGARDEVGVATQYPSEKSTAAVNGFTHPPSAVYSPQPDYVNDAGIASPLSVHFSRGNNPHITGHRKSAVNKNLHSRKPHLTDGAPRLTDGAPRLTDGAPRLTDGAPCLTDGAPRLTDGAPRLTDGAPRLTDGARYTPSNNTMPATFSSGTEDFSFNGEHYRDARDFQMRDADQVDHPWSQCGPNHSDTHTDCVSDRTEPGFHDDVSDRNEAGFGEEFHDRNTSVSNARSDSVKDRRPAKANQVFNAWNSNWMTDEFLFCPMSISKAGMTLVDHPISRQPGNCGQNSGPNSSRKQRSKIYMPHAFHKRKKKNKHGGHREGLDENMQELMMYNPLLLLAKKAKDMGFDFSTILEIAGPAGLQFNLPCMQCYEANGDHHSWPKSHHDSTSSGRCQNCGGKVSTIQSFSSMISNTKKLLVEKQFEFYDVYPDGNCMLRTIVDQLRVRGNFRFTIYSLREAAVDYLQRNPNAEDGTPLAMFLSGETWEEYLSRMSEDGQWGDHLVLKAVSNILQIHMVIYGGISGETETNIVPGDINDGTMPTIYMLHMGETHYVSLRPKNWRQQLQEENHKYLELWKQSDSRINAPFEFMMYPVTHVDFILQHTISLGYISSFLSENVGNMPDQNMESNEIKISMVGSVVCKMSPTCSNPTQSIDLDASLIFPVDREREVVVHYLIKFKILVNTGVHRRGGAETGPGVHRSGATETGPGVHRSGATETGPGVHRSGATETGPFDLYVENTDSSLLLVRLVPVVPVNWEAQTIPSGPGGSVCLKVINLPNSVHEEHHSEDCILKYQELAAFQCKWPERADEWLVRERPSDFPPRTIVHSIETNGCHIIPVISLQTENDVIDCVVTQDMILRQDTWCYTFAEAEKEICRALLDDQRYCYLMFKTCLDTICKTSPIPTSLMKSVFYYACEHIEGLDWKHEPGRCILIMLDKLIQGLEGKYIPHYFISQENLIRAIPETSLAVWIRGLEYMRFDPITMLYFTFDAIGLTSTEVGGMFDEVIDDLLKFGRHKSLQRSFKESLVPAAGRMVQSLIYLGDFLSAMAIVENLTDQWNEVSSREISLICTIRTVTSNMALGFSWCLAFMFDIKLKTNTTKEICASMDCVNVSDIFGPEIVEELPNTVVPFSYSIANGDLIFPTVCSKVIEQTGNMNLLAKSLRYYLGVYSSVAGNNLIIETQQCYKCPCGECGKIKQCLSLVKLYVKLLDAYVDINQVESFREVMPLFINIVEAAGDMRSYSYLAYAWEKLGEKQMALECRQGRSSPLSNMEQSLNSLFNMLGVK